MADTIVNPATAFADLPELLTVDEFCLYARCGKWTGYDLVRRGSVKSVHFGRLVRIPKSELLSATEVSR